MIRPSDRRSSAYDFFYRVYRDNPILEEQLVNRENVIAGLLAGCGKTNDNPDLEVPIALDSAFHEKVVAASASFTMPQTSTTSIPDPPAVTRIDPNGVAHVQFGFSGPSKKVLVCFGGARASLKVQFTIDRQVPLREPQN